jgi:hypothetical protein
MEELIVSKGFVPRGANSDRELYGGGSLAINSKQDTSPADHRNVLVGIASTSNALNAVLPFANRKLLRSSGSGFTPAESLLVAHSGHRFRRWACPLLEVKQTSLI